MGIWIRNQWKNSLAEKNYFYIMQSNYKFKIYAEGNTGSDEPIGEYSTKEKAIKVLDMIQQQIINSQSRGNYNPLSGEIWILNKVPAFQMPQDKDVK